MGDVIQFPFWRRQDQVAYSKVLDQEGDVYAFLLTSAEAENVTRPTKESAMRAAYELQQAKCTEITIHHRPDPALDYAPAVEISAHINEEDLPMEDLSDY